MASENAFLSGNSLKSHSFVSTEDLKYLILAYCLDYNYRKESTVADIIKASFRLI